MITPGRVWTVVILVAVLNSSPGQRVLAGVAATPAACAGRWAGIYATVVTPFYPHGGVDTGALQRQLRYELHGGVDGFLVLGTIGEGQYVSAEERAQVVATAVRTAGPGIPVVVGIHTSDLALAQAQLLQARDLGASAVLVKYLGNPHASATEVLDFYAALCDLQAVPLMYYHYPGQTGLRLSANEIAQVLSLPGVVGIKESTLNLREMEDHIRLTRGLGKAYFTCTALNLTQFLDVGGSGAMCPEAVVLPGPTVQTYTSYLQGHHEEARALQKALFVVEPIVGSSPLPAAIIRPLEMAAADHKVPLPLGPNHPQARMKAALTCLGVTTPAYVKCPLPTLSRRDLKRVREAVCRSKAIDWCESAMNVPPVPLHACEEEDDSGLLLKTGGIQLGPGTQENLIGWQGDGKGGFFGQDRP